MAPLGEADALAIHKAIHGKTASVLLTSGETAVEKTAKGLREVKVDGIRAMEQNKAKASKWATMAKDGSKITWFVVGNAPASWGRIVDGKVDQRGAAILPAGGAVKKKPAAAPKKSPKDEDMEVDGGEAQAEDEEEEAEVPPPPAKKAKAAPKPPLPTTGAPGIPAPAAAAAGSSSSSSGPPAAAAAGASATDTLALGALFEGGGHGAVWEPILRPVIEQQPGASAFIGPSRDKRTVPVRELTFQALKPNPPGGWRVVSFGQSPFPRIESATGIAHFDNAITSWDDSRFGSVVTMRCIIKAAAMHKYKVPKNTSTGDLRALLKEHDCVGPAEWFQAMLTQGVLFMNAACTMVPPEDKSVRAGSVVKEHAKFWQPVIHAVIDAILCECSKQGKGIVFAWWGSESLETKRALVKAGVLSKYPGVKIEHIDHKNPAAMGDAFCDPPNIFKQINGSLTKFGLGGIDWLPSVGWRAALGCEGGDADRMGDFIAETQALHKMYLERLRDGLDSAPDDLSNIEGIASSPLVSLGEALKALALEKAAEASVKKAGSMKRGELTEEEAAAVHMYTTNHLYKKLNEALRAHDRRLVEKYFMYLRLLLAALRKLPFSTKMLYRGVALDLASQYKEGSEVTWWAVSSCTPDLKVAQSFGGGAKVWTLFSIKPRTSVGIKELSEYKNEEEFVLAPGTQFRVTKVERKAKALEIHMAELDRPSRVQ